MRIRSKVPALALSVAILGGCGGAGVSVAGPATQSGSSGALHLHRDRSWMAPGATTKNLLYVTDGSVEVYSYPQGQLEGQLSGFSNAVGDCSDRKGNVYVTDYAANTVVEYAHGGTQPIRTLPVPGDAPWSCAVDRVTGNLAVTAAGDASGTGATLAIYRGAKGNPKTYSNREILQYAFCAYDGAGNLFVDGLPAAGYGYNFELAELARGKKSLKSVTLQGGIPWMGPLQWDGHYLAVGQPIRPTIWQYAVGERYGGSIGSTPLTGAYDARQFIIAGKDAIVVNEYYVDRYIVRWNVLIFNYPSGGSYTEDFLESPTPVQSVALSHRGR